MKLIDRSAAMLLRFTVLLVAGVAAMRARADREDADRGDVPGWVMITLMTAIVVTGLLTIFKTQVIEAVTAAFNSVK